MCMLSTSTTRCVVYGFITCAFIRNERDGKRRRDPRAPVRPLPRGPRRGLRELLLVSYVDALPLLINSPGGRG